MPLTVSLTVKYWPSHLHCWLIRLQLNCLWDSQFDLSSSFYSLLTSQQLMSVSLSQQSVLSIASATNSSPPDTNPTSKGVRNDSGGSCKKEPADESITSPCINSFGTTFGNSRRYIDMSGSDPDDEPAAQTITHDQDMRSPRPIISFDGLCRPSNGTRRRVNETPKQGSS